MRKIGQSSPLAGESNTITVTIQTNWYLAATDSSVVTISGLTNAPDTPSLALTSVGNSGADLFSDGATQGKGALSSGTLRLTVHTGETVQAGTQYAFSFTITNPSSAQDAGTVSIAASGTAPFASAAMTTDTADVYGLTDGGKPLKVAEPTWRVAFGGCVFFSFSGPLERSGSCPTTGGVLFLSGRGITSVKNDSFAGMGACT